MKRIPLKSLRKMIGDIHYVKNIFRKKFKKQLRENKNFDFYRKNGFIYLVGNLNKRIVIDTNITIQDFIFYCYI